MTKAKAKPVPAPAADGGAPAARTAPQGGPESQSAVAVHADRGLRIMDGIDGRRDLTETTRGDLSGYAGAPPVPIGNGAFDQRQNDVVGAALDSILLHTERGQRPPRRLWPLVHSQAECAKAVWRNRDQGIWEARGKPQHYVSPRLMRRRGIAVSRSIAPRSFSSTASTSAACRASTTRSSASTLLAAIFGVLPGTDDRLRASVLAIADELTEHGLVLRYKTDETDDGLSGKQARS